MIDGEKVGKYEAVHVCNIGVLVRLSGLNIDQRRPSMMMMIIKITERRQNNNIGSLIYTQVLITKDERVD